MQCRICKEEILPRRHFLSCQTCSHYFHRKPCLPTISPTLWTHHKLHGWVCNYCNNINNINNDSTNSIANTNFVLFEELPDLHPSQCNLSPPSLNIATQNSPHHISNNPDSTQRQHNNSTIADTIPSQYDKLKYEKGLKICHLNVNSLRNKFDDVLHLIIDCKLDILALTESKLDNDRYTEGMYVVNGYSTIRVDRTHNKGGGLLIYIRNEINFEPVDCSISIQKDSEIQIFRIKLPNCSPILIVILYMHPATNNSELTSFISSLNVFLVSLEQEYLILGDFNCDLLKRDANAFNLINTGKEFKLWQHITGPTHKGLSLLDLAFSSIKTNISASGHFPYTSSDHDVIYLVRRVKKPKLLPKFINYRCYKNCDVLQLNNQLALFEFNVSSSVQEEFKRYNSYYMSLLDIHAPLKRRQVKPQLNPWYTSDIATMRKHRDKLRNIADKTKDIVDIKNYRIARNH